MSVFIATVPEGTQLYHGTSKAERINGTQFLAFEPEHAAGFARPRRGPPGRGGPPGPENAQDDGEDWHPPERAPDAEPPVWQHGRPKNDLKARHPHEDPPLTHTAAQRERARMPAQEPLEESHGQVEEEAHGYLHTYVPKRDLRLLYVDGQSAAKSDKGTLDMQDIVLLQNAPIPEDDRKRGPGHKRPSKDKESMRRSKSERDEKPEMKDNRVGGPMGEGFRAEHMCDLAAKEWKGRIDGFVRMELGFEIILCNFDETLNVVRITEVKQSSGKGGPGGNSEDKFSHYQAVASRFDGIGGDRVRVNYGNFVSLFADEKAIYFDEHDLPRVKNETAILKPVMESITDLVLKEDDNTATDWQAIADMVVARYGDRIEYLASGEIKDLPSFQAEIDRALRPFIDYSARNRSAEIRRCATQYVLTKPKSTDLAAHAIINVSATLCSRLSAAGEKTTLSEALATVQDLKKWLAWTSWKRCRGCSYHEVCFIPIWPMGSAEERDSPKCVSNMSETSRGYWGGMGGGGPPHGKD